MAKKANKKLSVFEAIWYPLTGAVGVWGLVYIILGLIANNYPETLENNPLLKASNKIQEAFGLGFLWWGVIILAIASVAAVIVLLAFGDKADKENEKTTRRAARLAAALEEDNVVEAKVEETPAEEKAE